MLHILIVCTGNTCRSPMAEVLLREKIRRENFDQQIVVSSAGVAVWSEDRASRGAQEAMGQRGINIENHRSRRLLVEHVVTADLLLTMTNSHKAAVLSLMPEAANKVFTLAEFSGGNKDISDPYGGNTAVYEACAVEIEKMLEKSWAKIVKLAGKKNCVEKNDE
jgi:protein-tyrosine-phosphatase